MLANELRIGNYVSFEVDSENLTSLVDVIGVDSIWVTIEDELPEMLSRTQELGYISVDPIPLTEQWLKDFGLKTYTKSSYNMAMGTIIITHPQSMQFVAGLDDLSGEFTVQIDLRYVHQLQNLYFCLTGKELTKC